MLPIMTDADEVRGSLLLKMRSIAIQKIVYSEYSYFNRTGKYSAVFIAVNWKMFSSSKLFGIPSFSPWSIYHNKEKQASVKK